MLRQAGLEDVHEHSEYRIFESQEIEGRFYVQVSEKSTEGALPHGDACYIPEWDVILVQPEVVGSTDNTLTPLGFTILAHELGHRLAYAEGLAKLWSDPQFDVDEDESLAWKKAIEKFGSNKKFDHEHVKKYL